MFLSLLGLDFCQIEAIPTPYLSQTVSELWKELEEVTCFLTCVLVVKEAASSLHWQQSEDVPVEPTQTQKWLLVSLETFNFDRCCVPFTRVRLESFDYIWDVYPDGTKGILVSTDNWKLGFGLQIPLPKGRKRWIIFRLKGIRTQAQACARRSGSVFTFPGPDGLHPQWAW